jgi:DNA-binding XRE family transcriptional regulator
MKKKKTVPSLIREGVKKYKARAKAYEREQHVQDVERGTAQTLRGMDRLLALTLRDLRKSKGLTLQAVSEQTGIPLATIQALETGRGKNYNVELKHTLADFYGVPMLDLFAEERERIEHIKGTVRQVQMFIPREQNK